MTNPATPRPTVVVRSCMPDADPALITSTVHEMLGRVPGLDDRLARARRIFIKINLSPNGHGEYRGRSVEYVDPVVFRALASYVAERTRAEILVGDGTDGIGFERAAVEEGHAAIMQEMGLTALNLNLPPARRFVVPRPVMFRWYDLSATLADMDLFISLAKMKAHHLCGVTLSIKNLFGMPPNTVYGSPRVSLHSAVRIAGVLADLLQLCPPGLCLVDGIVGANYEEWGGDPVCSGVLIAGDNAVATDAAAARWMGVDPGAPRGTPPFIRADNHIRLCAEHGLGSIAEEGSTLDGEMPPGRRQFAPAGSSEPDYIAKLQEARRSVCRLAQEFFEHRDRFVRDHCGEIISLLPDRVLRHGSVGPGFTERFFRAFGDAGLPVADTAYRSFMKLVEPEEAELSERYSLP